MKTLYVRKGAKDDSNNAVGFKAEPGSEEARRLLKDGFVPVDETGTEVAPTQIAPMTTEDLMALDLKQLKAIAREVGIKGYSNLHEVQLVAAILAVQADTDQGNSQNA